MDPILERRVSVSARESHGFELGRAFSSGRQGVVYHAEHIKSRREAVVKICYFSKDSKRAKFKVEVQNTLVLQHSRYVAKVIHHYEDEKYGVMYLKKYETDLLEYLMDHPFTVRTARKVFFRVCKGVLEAHQMGIAHRDLKPENVFLDSKGRPVVGDFGSSVRGEKGMRCDECIGTELYCAPEVLRGERYDPFACDVFSLGIMLHVLVCGHWPYAGSSKAEVREHIKSGKLKMMESAFNRPSLHLIKAMTAYRSSERPTMAEVLAHEWFMGGLTDCHMVTPQASLEEPFPYECPTHSSDDESEEQNQDRTGYGRFGSVVGQEATLSSLSSDRLSSVSARAHPKRHRSLSTSLQRIGLSGLSRIARMGRSKNRIEYGSSNSNSPSPNESPAASPSIPSRSNSSRASRSRKLSGANVLPSRSASSRHGRRKHSRKLDEDLAPPPDLP